MSLVVQKVQVIRFGRLLSDAAETNNNDELVRRSDSAVKQILFTDLLEEIKAAWKNAWEDYWTGI